MVRTAVVVNAFQAATLVLSHDEDDDLNPNHPPNHHSDRHNQPPLVEGAEEGDGSPPIPTLDELSPSFLSSLPQSAPYEYTA